MDQYIELIVYYLSDWKSTAISNTLYSVVLAALAFFLGGLLINLLKRLSIKGLNQQLEEKNQALEQANNKQQELFNKQKEDEEQMLSLTQETKQLSNKLQANEQLLNKTVDEKKIAEEGFETSLNDKTKYSEQLEVELQDQKNKLSEYVVVQTKLQEMERQASEAINETDQVKQQIMQLQNDLNNKDKQIEQLENSNQPAESEEMQQQLANLESEIQRLQSKNHDTQSKVASPNDLEGAIEQQNQQLAQFNDKLKLLLIQPFSEAPEVANDEEQSDGMVNKVKNLFKSTDNQLDGENELNITSTTQAKDVWQQHQSLIQQLTEQLAINQIEPVKAEAIVQEANSEPEETIIQPILEDNVDLNTEKTNDITESIEYAQGKLKSFFNKIKS